MTTFLFIYIAFLTLFIVGLLSFYEDKLKIKKSQYSADHYTYLQLKNADLNNKINELYHVNEVLQYQNEKLKKDNQELINGILPQYESHAYKSNVWESSGYYQEDIDFEQ